MNRRREILATLGLVALFAAGLLIGAWLGFDLEEAPKPSETTVREEIHHEPTIIEKTFNRTYPTKETTKFKKKPCKCPAPVITLPDTGGQDLPAGGKK